MPVTDEVDNQERLEDIRNATKTTPGDGQVGPEVYNYGTVPYCI